MKIIYVDTNKYAQIAMREQISQIMPEAELHCFNQSETALEYAKLNGCDVLMTEIELGRERLGGIRLANAIKEVNQRLSAIFVTVCSEYEVSGELSRLHVGGFFPKPWDTQALAEALQNLTAQ